MSDNVSFREKSQPAVKSNLPSGRREQIQDGQEVELPYTEEVTKNGQEFLAKNYDLGEYWNEDNLYEPELSAIDSYIQEKIHKGDLANTKQAVMAELKHMERLNNLKKDERAAVKIGILSSYAKFMRQAHEVRRDAAKYGRY